MKLPRRNFLQLAAGAAALPAVSRIAQAQTCLLYTSDAADVAAGPAAVLDDDLLAEPLRQPLADKTRDDISPASRRETDDDAHRPRRIGLRPSEA